MQQRLEIVERLLHESRSQEALELADELISAGKTVARALYLRGNAHLQLGHRREALNDYLASMEIEPDGPAAEAYRHCINVLDTYCTDYYNP
ncbi:MAG: tetratricopeptide repeat protein [Muribaculaceae bacterium]|nr:tetratricopeptide repeat protein [Muribaculaceae bacterium]